MTELGSLHPQEASAPDADIIHAQRVNDLGVIEAFTKRYQKVKRAERQWRIQKYLSLVPVGVTTLATTTPEVQEMETRDIIGIWSLAAVSTFVLGAISESRQHRESQRAYELAEMAEPYYEQLDIPRDRWVVEELRE